MRNILKDHSQNAVKILFQDPFQGNQYSAYLWINSLKFYTAWFYCMPSRGQWKYTETKPQTTCVDSI